MKRSGILMFALVLTSVFAGAAFADMFEIVITNDIPGGLETGQPFSPPVCVVHDSGYHLFTPGELASPGIVAVAEEGSPTTLAAEAMASSSVSLVVVGDGPFFDPQTIMVEGEPGDLFSCAWMLGRTNDLFSGLHDVALPGMEPLSMMTTVWDAGSEVNTGMIEDLGFYGNPMTGPDEEEPIMAVSSYTVFDDPDHGVLSWDFPPSATVTITNTSSVAVETSSLSAVKQLFE